MIVNCYYFQFNKFNHSRPREEKVKTIVDDIVDKIPDQFNMADIMARIEERTPYIVVAFQVRSWFL